MARNVDEFVRKGVVYIWFASSGNAPIKRVDFIKTILPDSRNLYNSVIYKIQERLKQIFGTTLWAYNERTLEVSGDVAGHDYHSLIMTSTLKIINLMQKHVYYDGSLLGQNIRDYEKENTIRTLLFMYLGLIFMKGMQHGLDEKSLLEIVENMEFNNLLSVKQSDFKKFLKMEYVSTLYLINKEMKDEQGNVTSTHYFWGPRSDMEYSKWDIFNRIVEMLPENKTTLDFPVQMQYILNSSEKTRALETCNNTQEANDSYTDNIRQQLQLESESESGSEHM